MEDLRDDASLHLTMETAMLKFDLSMEKTSFLPV